MKLFPRKSKNCTEKLLKAGLWFVDIPRTGSTSVKLSLGKSFGIEFDKSYVRSKGKNLASLFDDHTTANDVIGEIGVNNWASLYTFTFVRNPWSRMYSLYNYRLAHGDFDDTVDFKSYIHSFRVPRYRDIKSPYIYKPYHMSMCDYIMNTNNELLVKDVFKYEEREQALIHLNKKTGIDFSGYWEESTHTLEDYKMAYDDETLEIIAVQHADDISYFDYSF